MKFQKLSTVIGAETFDWLTFPLSEESRAEIKDALKQYGVLAFRNQVGFTNDNQLELTELCGPVSRAQRPGKYMSVEGALSVLQHGEDEGYINAQNWHCDGVFDPAPFKAICLRALQLPECGGDTLFCSFDSVYSAFSKSFREFLGGLTVRSSPLPPIGDRRYLQTRAAPMDHALVVKRDGKESLFFSPLWARDIPQLTAAESSSTLALLRQQVNAFRHQLRLHWAPDSVVLWDNTAVCHAVSIDYLPAVRTMARTLANGDPLIAAGNPPPGTPALYMPTKRAA